MKYFNLNLVVMVARLTRDPELKYTPSGNPVCHLNVATTYSYKKGDEWENESSFFKVVVLGQTAERIAETAQKGCPVFINGRLQSRSWDDKKTNQRVTIVEIVAYKVVDLTEREKVTGEQKQIQYDSPTPKATSKPADLSNTEEFVDICPGCYMPKSDCIC